MLSELHVQGGTPFMLPIDLVGIINLGLIGYMLFSYFTKKSISEAILERLKHLGGLALAFGAFGTLVGLFFAFGALEEMKETLFELIRNSRVNDVPFPQSFPQSSRKFSAHGR